MRFIVLLGRILYSALFISAGFGHFTQKTIEFAVSKGVPMASFLIPLSGIIALLGGLSVLLGYKARIGAWLIVIFLIPSTFMMHKFWAQTDHVLTMIQHKMFMKNLSLLGAALLIAYFGSGPLSFDTKAKKKK